MPDAIITNAFLSPFLNNEPSIPQPVEEAVTYSVTLTSLGSWTTVKSVSNAVLFKLQCTISEWSITPLGALTVTNHSSASQIMVNSATAQTFATGAASYGNYQYTFQVRYSNSNLQACVAGINGASGSIAGFKATLYGIVSR